jgi:hypothetical protein
LLRYYGILACDSILIYNSALSVDSVLVSACTDDDYKLKVSVASMMEEVTEGWR